ncbi:hypothetical protein MSEDJ_54710 [Mycolicibacterium sediminis]|uniref:O-acyltransferase WSD1 C-terminal domain-containing protein n=1 Tax=Mycolicibacterium sediminis TaxID=1286180 RepID=A0A7I7QYM5_9MYCO|nr:hypothetical protein MSEDJ_54710 [Mycolicibacterium sediminis]
MPRLTPFDAQVHWLSAKIPNDTFLLFGFDGVPDDLDAALAEVRARAAACTELATRVGDAGGLRFPAWEPTSVTARQTVVHEPADHTWRSCLDAVVPLIADQLDATVTAWRLHVFPAVDGMPGATGLGTIAVLQISHALGGGGRTSLTAAVAFGRHAVLPEVTPWRVGPARLPLLGVRAARAHRRLVADTESGRVPPPAPLRPVLRTNARPAGARRLRMVVRSRAELARPTVTVGALSAISEALAGHLGASGEDPSALGAELMIAKAGPRRAYNHFGSAGIGLHPDAARADRADLLTADIAARRERAAHPAMVAEAMAFAATPAPLMRWGAAQFDPDVRVDAVTGNTVVSSVNGGAADYSLGGRPVVLLAAFPGLSPMMGLTHCVSGIGDTVSISVHAAQSAVDDVDAYVARLEAALDGY